MTSAVASRLPLDADLSTEALVEALNHLLRPGLNVTLQLTRHRNLGAFRGRVDDLAFTSPNAE